MSGCPGLRQVTQPVAARQGNFAHPWITAEITGEFITQGEIRRNVGERAAGNILSCVCTAQPCKGTPCASVAFRRPRGAAEDPLSWQDLEVPSPTTAGQRHAPLRGLYLSQDRDKAPGWRHASKRLFSTSAEGRDTSRQAEGQG